eukprot:11212270-Karenia_brevis.AAC.1
MHGESVEVYACGALVLKDGTDSMSAEIQACELAVEALCLVSAGHMDVCPHRCDAWMTMSELLESESQ